MKIAVIQFPGSNCERETILAIQRAGMEAVAFLWNEPLDKLTACDGFVIVGGFSYEDRSRAGIIAALDPVMKTLKAQSEAGKPVLGICNGAQVLVESGLVPGLKDGQPAMALTENKRIAKGKILGTGFYNAWINMKPSSAVKQNAFTRHLNSQSILKVPSAHAEGRFLMSETLLKEIEEKGLNAFVYCDEQGQIDEHFPVNPNGSMGNLAAVINSAGNVMAMMPHPERTTAGDAIFKSMRDYIAEGAKSQATALAYEPKRSTAMVFEKPAKAYELLVELMITDNQALTVQNTLRHLGIEAQVKCLSYWQITPSSEPLIQQVMDSGVLYNERKESAMKASEYPLKKNELAFLVCAKDDLIGQQKRQTLKDHFSMDGIEKLRHGRLWVFQSTTHDRESLATMILNSNILSNPYAYDCYRYE